MEHILCREFVQSTDTGSFAVYAYLRCFKAVIIINHVTIVLFSYTIMSPSCINHRIVFLNFIVIQKWMETLKWFKNLI